MIKFFTALFVGMLITFIIDFFIFLGIQLHYIDVYEIHIYYNILFADNQNIFLFFIPSLIFGFIVIYISNTKLTMSALILGSAIGLSALIPTIGHSIGEMMFMQENMTFKESKHSFSGTTYYDGRTSIYFYDNELKRMIILQKKDLIK